MVKELKNFKDGFWQLLWTPGESREEVSAQKKNAEDIKQSLIKNNAGIWYYLSKLHFTLRLDGELCSARKGTSSERV